MSSGTETPKANRAKAAIHCFQADMYKDLLLILMEIH